MSTGQTAESPGSRVQPGDRGGSGSPGRKPRPGHAYPRDSASLVIVREGASGPEVLMGRRHAKSAFLPDVWVYPGGRMSRDDIAVARYARSALRPGVAARVERSAPPAKANGLAITALRETFEETGLLIGRPSTDMDAMHAAEEAAPSPYLEACVTHGVVPVLDRLDYLGRAVTTPARPIRFNARFFLIDADHVHGELAGDGELHDLQWVTPSAAHRLPLAPITYYLLGEVLKHRRTPRADDSERRSPFFTLDRGVAKVDYE